MNERIRMAVYTAAATTLFVLAGLMTVFMLALPGILIFIP